MQAKFGVKILLAVSVLLTGSNLPGVIYPIAVQADEARSDWKPSATVNVTQPIQIQIVNQLGEPLGYLLRSQTDNLTLENNKTVNLQVKTLPAYLSVNPTVTGTYMQSQVTAENNVVTILVRPATVRGARALEINEKGEVFAY